MDESSNKLQIVGQPHFVADRVTFFVRGQVERRTLVVTITDVALFALPHADDMRVLNEHDPLKLVHLQAAAILAIVARKLATGEISDTGILIDKGDLTERG